MKKIFSVLFLLLFITGMASAQWTPQTSGVTTQLTSVSAPDDNNAWICGYAGKVLRTTNGGTTWTAVTNPSANDNYNMYAVDANNALVTYSPGATFVKRTTDGGATWTQVFTQATPGFIDAIWMTTPTTGFMYGDPVGNRWSLWKTIDGGATWDSTGLYQTQVSGEAGWNNAIFVLGTAIWFGTNATHMYYSPTNGITGSWVSETTPAANQYSTWFNTPTIGISGGAGLYSTTNAGVTWSNLTAPGTGNVSGITGAGADYWFVRQANIIYRSTNNGAAWSPEFTGPTGAVFNHIGKSRAGTRMWAVTSAGLIFKSDGPVGIVPINNEVPNAYSLNQNYPNPFNPATTIKYSIPQASYVTVKIYDMLGNEVMTVVNEHQNAGTYAGSVDASNLASGVYFYTIRAGNFTDTKKMMLVK
jgi:photosystem II stability/assembly factor-like uncharacterized protein